MAQDDAGERRASPPRAEHGVGAGEAVEVRGDDAEEDAAGAGHRMPPSDGWRAVRFAASMPAKLSASG